MEKKLTFADAIRVARDFYRDGGQPGYDCKNYVCVYFGNEPNIGCAWGAVFRHLGFSQENFPFDLDQGTSIEILAKDMNLGEHFEDPTIFDRPESPAMGRSLAGELQAVHDDVAKMPGITARDVEEAIELFAIHQGIDLD